MAVMKSGEPAPDDDPAAALPLMSDSLAGLPGLRAMIIIGFTAGCTVAVMTDWTSPVRAALAIGFLLFCPGLALAELLDIRDLAQRFAIATGASLALGTLVSLLLIYTGAFSIRLTVAILAALTLTMLGASVLRTRFRGQRSQSQEPSA
jgi:uncharacterized membrane protein